MRVAVWVVVTVPEIPDAVTVTVAAPAGVT
jgi:hypothetical protein